jgi:two-component system, cell cycle sensor histidine kinase and response regulator CckA
MQVAEKPRKQILIVEDEGLIADDIQRRLERMGYSVPAIANSGEEAIECARSTPFDLVLMDIRLKGELDGIATAELLKDKWQTPVVYLTAHADQDTVGRAKMTEPFGYVLKPITDGSLSTTVQIALYKAEMERHLRTSEAWLSTTLRSVGEGIIATNPAGEIVFTNSVAEQLTGWSSSEAHGRLLMDVLVLVEESSHVPAKNPTFDLFASEIRAYTLVPKTGANTPVEVACFENRSADELLGSILVVRDISARRALEARLIQSQRMEAVSNMAGGLAHDFNNLLTVILGYAEELCARLSNQEQSWAREIKAGASLASSISTQLLTLSRHDVLRPEIINVDDVICEIQPLLSHCLGRPRTLTTELGSATRLIRADRNRLKQVFLNLALNARDAMAAGGELRIESSALYVAPETPMSRHYRSGQYVRVRVADSGEGMDDATLARIFEPFFTTKKPGAGTGLGLSIVHSIIVQSEGYISAESAPGNGTSFEILLPCIGTSQGLGRLSESATPDPTAPTVLLVDDDDSVRKLMHRYLEQQGFQLLEASNAEEAELIAETYREPIHILVTDVAMPGRSGVELAKRLSQVRPEVKTLFVSGYHHDNFDADWAIKDNVDVLVKSFLAPDLVQRVKVLLGQETPRLRQ